MESKEIEMRGRALKQEMTFYKNQFQSLWTKFQNENLSPEEKEDLSNSAKKMLEKLDEYIELTNERDKLES